MFCGKNALAYLWQLRITSAVSQFLNDFFLVKVVPLEGGNLGTQIVKMFLQTKVRLEQGLTLFTENT